MRRHIQVISVLAIVLSACSATGEGTTTSAGEAITTTTRPQESETTAATQPAETTTSSEAAATETTSNRPLAPEFSLELGDGGTYTLSEGAKPVYLVFWAEW